MEVATHAMYCQAEAFKLSTLQPTQHAEHEMIRSASLEETHSVCALDSVLQKTINVFAEHAHKCVRTVHSPLKHTSTKMTTPRIMSTLNTHSFMRQFCHHILVRSARPFFWNVSACVQGQSCIDMSARSNSAKCKPIDEHAACVPIESYLDICLQKMSLYEVQQLASTECVPNTSLSSMHCRPIGLGRVDFWMTSQPALVH